MLDGIVRRWQSRLDALVRSSVWASIVGLALGGALVFSGVAVFIRAQEDFGTIGTSLGFAMFFLVVAAIAAVGLFVVRRTARRREAIVARSAAQAVPPWWMDPRLISTGLSLGRTLGGRRALSLGLVGAFVIGMMLSRGVDRR
ncbi:MAG: hypothetical protein HXX10_08820 [Rhodoplanes sp.]|uniref:hypothetical protein n=1 Tax=Rhodoplanes sp. TaxID=1968906 RepID=UPI0018042489|nr:hypothetical protein [Rhodoplanes sp.]NVO14125.1 hypothetical protein [Rhodoplanes sp.]